MPRRKCPALATGALTAVVALTLADPSLASSGGGGLPWESPLQQIQQSITGPVMGFVALAAVAVAGAMLIFGGEMNEFARRIIYLVLVLGLMLGAAQIVNLFGATGASIGEPYAAISPMPEPAASHTRAGEGSDG